MTSQKQIDANRRNALKSTGPRTDVGKQKSRRNARVHGILATAFIAGAGEHSDEATQYTKQLEALRERYQPADAIEDLLVQRLALDSVQMASAARAEFGGRRAERTALAGERRAWRSQGIHELVAVVRTPPPDCAPHEGTVLAERRAAAAAALRDTSVGVTWLLRTLDQRAAELREQRSDGALEELRMLFGDDDTELGAWLRAPDRDTTDHVGLSALPLPDQLAGMVQEQRTHLEGLAAAREREEADEIEAASALPSGETLDRILRYNKTIHNAFLRDLHELERIQALRQERAWLPTPFAHDEPA
jgi:hypothetical protein